MLHAVVLPAGLDNGLIAGFGQSNLTVEILVPLATTFDLGRVTSNGDQGTFCCGGPSVCFLDTQEAIDNGDAGAYDGQIHLHVGPNACGGESVWKGLVCAIHNLCKEGGYLVQLTSKVGYIDHQKVNNAQNAGNNRTEFKR